MYLKFPARYLRSRIIACFTHTVEPRKPVDNIFRSIGLLREVLVDDELDERKINSIFLTGYQQHPKPRKLKLLIKHMSRLS